MFSGIITETGEILEIKPSANGKIFAVNTKNILKAKKIGQSIAINGVCTTITNISGNTFTFDAMPETLKVTNLDKLKTGEKVNLESSMKVGQEIDGHMVQGHIDATGEVLALEKNDKRTVLSIKFPKNIAKYLALKGSIAINGVSLTVSDLQADSFSVDLIPHTLKITNLGDLQKNDQVNLEIDIFARYLEAMLSSKEAETKYAFLKERNLI